MNKLFFLLFAIFFSCTPLYGQVVKINGGMSTMITLQNSQDVEGMLTDEPRMHSFLAGINYFGNNHFYLSTEIGYQRFVSEQNLDVGGLPDPWIATEQWNYIHLNTTFRYKIFPEDCAHFYAGAGPKVDILAGSDQFDDHDYQEYQFTKNRFVPGAKTELGFVYPVGRIHFDLNAAYIFDIGDIGGNGNIDFRRKNNVLLSLSIGYKLY